ncbi:hypothetical protein V1502_19225 [Bacillus sp. SCS-153A]|uniref:hypothetical protein n=1 Tax=Rossellomorea sedimentorum TaxID=3115294 RepID=UPI003905BF30
MICIHTILLWYTTVFISTSMISETNALFKSSASNSNELKAQWAEVWDKSSLTFWNSEVAKKYKETQGIKKNDKHFGFSCEEGFYSDIYNDGSTMAGTSLYMLRFNTTEQGDPNPNRRGQIVHENKLPILRSEELIRLTYKTDLKSMRPGIYKFTALQRPQHPGGVNLKSVEYPERIEIWAEEAISVTPEQINACSKPDLSKKSVEDKAAVDKTTTEEKPAAEDSTKQKKQEQNEKAPLPSNEIESSKPVTENKATQESVTTVAPEKEVSTDDQPKLTSEGSTDNVEESQSKESTNDQNKGSSTEEEMQKENKDKANSN